MKDYKPRVLALLVALSMTAGLVPAARAATGGDTIYVSASGTDGNTGTDPADPVATLGAAYAAVNDGGTIIILGDLDLRGKVAFDQDKTVTLDGGGNTVTYTGAATIGPDRYGFFTVTAGGLELSNVTVQLPEVRGANGRVLYVGVDGAVTLHTGAVLANGYLGYGGGVAKVDGGTLTMEAGAGIRDGYVANNTTAYGGGVLVSAGSFTMEGGSITGNTIHTTLGYDSYGGGVAVEAGAVFTMTGGTIQSNGVDTAAGGVYVAPGGTLELGGPAAITGNLAAGTANNLYLPTTSAVFSQTAAATGTIGISHGEGDYGVVVGTPGGYVIQTGDEAAYTYDDGSYDIRLKEGSIVLYYWTVDVDIDGDHFDSSFTEDEAIRGQDFDTVLTPAEGYELPDSITVTVGGTELGGDSFTYDPDTGAVHIPGEAVTGDIIITVSPNALIPSPSARSIR